MVHEADACSQLALGKVSIKWSRRHLVNNILYELQISIAILLYRGVLFNINTCSVLEHDWLGL